MRRLLILCVALVAPLLTMAGVRVGQLEVEQLTKPLSIERAQPRLSWIITSDEKGVMQTAYHLLVASDPSLLEEGKADLWDSGIVASDQSIWVPYAGKKLTSNQRCYWRVKVYTTQGASAWSESSEWGMGLLGESAWGGRWIGWEAAFPWDKEVTISELSSRYIRHEFALAEKPIKRATIHIAGLGMYELFINGQIIGDQVLAPVPSDYRRTITYNSFDVTEQLKSQNAIGVVLGNGRWYTMRQNYKPYKIPNFGYPKMRLNLIVEYEDGTRERIASDPSWRLTAQGPIRSNNEYDGEIYDANKELGAWTEVGYDDSTWLKAQRVGIPYGTLRGATSPNMKIMKRLPVKSVTHYEGRTIVDFGQNMAGWVKLNVRDTKQGDTIMMRYAERLTDGGDSLFTRNLRDARSRDIYIADGTEQNKKWSARFSYHGFRYIEVTGMKNPTAEDFEAEFVFDNFETVGHFHSSNEVMNTVYRNAWWGIASNYKGVPLDCPQRNERQPWLGDHAVGTWGETFMFDCGTMYAKWVDDMREAQREDGCIPDVVPAFWNYYTDGMVWQSVLPIICDMLYEQTGNLEPLRKNYGAMKLWLDHMRENYSNAEGLITKEKYGDWCVPPESLDLIHSKDPMRVTNSALIATAYYSMVSKMMVKFATLLGEDADREDYAARAEATKEAFNRAFLHVEEGTSPAKYPHPHYPDRIYYDNNTVTANLLAVAFDLVPEEYREAVERSILHKLVVENKNHISSGVCGQNWTLRYLTKMGRGDVAYTLASQDSYPSFGYMAKRGATTIWELWNGDTANPWMNSGNHVMMLGDLVPWFYRDLGGINPAKPGYKEIRLAPDFSIQNLERIETSYKSLHGTIVSSYTKSPMRLEWDVEIPCNTTATIVVPTLDPNAIQEEGVRFLGEENGMGTWRVPSGKYHFSIALDPSIGEDREGILVDEFLYEKAPFIECHASTIEELPNGDLIAAYFGGTRERNPDVCIWTQIKKKGSDSWSEPRMVADGIQNDTLRYACWNPVLFQVPTKGGELWLFYKVGPNVPNWKGYLIRSKNGGKSWSKPEQLPDGIFGAIKNKPLWIDGRILCPSSDEMGRWSVHFEYTDDLGKTWQRTAPLDSELNVPTRFRPLVTTKADIGKEAYDESKALPIEAIQPSIIKLADGRLKMLCRTRNGKTGIAYSSDRGTTWSKLTLDKELEQNQSGIDAVTLRDGRHVLVYNNFETIDGTPKGPRTPLSVAVSEDGEKWQHVMTLEDSPISQYSYPAVIEAADGTIHTTYTWRRRRIKHVEFKLEPIAQ
ncbi:MAG: family 78 glycoside hydrolase catalytic domain [Rikenellaceae bacterium]|nr:family 78 glycoside hydrolase catalytic domain [Rikenellaceae bacterium]